MPNNKLWILGFVALLAASCAKSTEPEDFGTNTNWMKTCSASSQCDGDDQCLCGVCTQPCAEDEQCGAVHAATRCEAVEAAACGEVSATAACLQGCETSADCTSLEDGQCTEGLCVPDRPPVANLPDAEVPADGSVVPGDPYALRREGSTVPITDIYLACAESSECILELQGCGGCCPSVAVREDLWETYEEQLDLACEGQDPRPTCDCAEPVVFPVCRDNRCTTVHIEDDCYSPYENLELAYVSEAYGCSCEELEIGASICVGRAALFCGQTVPSGQHWVAVEDGPCGEPERSPTCEAGEVRPTPEACLAEFRECYQLESGGFCGSNP